VFHGFAFHVLRLKLPFQLRNPIITAMRARVNRLRAISCC